MSKIIAVCNQKGGVGKTTTTFNLGAALALEQGKKVLLIDLDPQANLSEYLQFDDDNDTITDILLAAAKGKVISTQRLKASIRTNEKNKLDYLPADLNLANAEMLMTTVIARETILKRLLCEEVVKQYDYVLIDCLPSLGLLLINALSAADEMIIPVQTQKFSLDGLQALVALYEQIRSTINPKIALIGILPTMADNTTVSKDALERLRSSNIRMFETIIHKSVEAAKSSENGKALCRTKNRLGDEYKALASEICHLNVTEDNLEFIDIDAVED